MDNVNQCMTQSQDSSPESLINDLGEIRRKMLQKQRRRRSGVLAGQFRIQSYQNGRRPPLRVLKRFFFLIAREAT